MKTIKTIIRNISLIALIGLCPLSTFGQIRIGGNVYGGGNHAEVRGCTRVTVKAGDIGAVIEDVERPLQDPAGRVFGGARMSNVGGNSFVNIDGEHATDYILINQVFGGNDIAGTIGTTDTIPAALTAVKDPEVPADATNYKKNAVDNTFNSFVRISTKTAHYTQEEIDAAVEGDPAYGKTTDDEKHYTEEEITAASTDPEKPAYGKRTTDVKPADDAKKVYIGQLFAGGNGDFTYTDENGDSLIEDGKYVVKQNDIVIAKSTTPFVLPEQNKTYLEIKGGSIVYGYGGGNNATVKEQNIIHIDNPSAVVNHIKVDATGKEDANGTDLLTTARFKEMGINTTFSQPSSGEYQVGRFFGGNNKAEMSIRPTWNLLAGKVRNLYSGGNRGSMTSPEGLLLEIKDYSSLIVDNLYGGCRMADVRPTKNGNYSPCINLPGYNFPNELSARVLVAGGHINNVYGGNDVTGTVYGGNAVGIHTTVYGDVYGGGNGAYPYTSNEELENDSTYGDFYFEGGNNAMTALKAFRPNAEQVSLHLMGKSSTEPTVIHGSVFVGGNCASLAVKKSQPMVELKIGSHVIADNVYLGNNGEGMIDKSYLERYVTEGFNSWGLETDHVAFAQYMDGVAMTLMPKIVFDSQENGDKNNYEEYSSFIGSFFCGGNVGSMAIPGKMTFELNHGLNIYNKFVGGCNNADIAAQPGLNTAYNGGIIGSEDERDSYTDEDGNIKDRLEIHFENMTVVPMRWSNTFAPIEETDIILSAPGVKTGKLIEGKAYYTSNLQSTKFIAKGDESVDLNAANKYYKMTEVGQNLEWNTAKWSNDESEFKRVENDAVDSDTRLINGNVYGGCYNSGHVNGNVVLNINDDVLKKDEIFGEGTSTFYGYPKSGVDFESQRDDAMTSALYVYGAGHGVNTEIWGSTTINHNNGYAFQLFGGGEEGAVGKRQLNADGTSVLDAEGNYIYTFNPKYSTTVNLNGITPVFSHKGTVDNLVEAEYLYGGGNEGIVAGNTLVNLGNGRIYDAFGGASNADILGHTEVYIGRQPNGSGEYKDGFPWIMDNIYGGNDFGGTIKGQYEDGFDFTSRVRDYETYKTQIYGYKAGEVPDVLSSSTYVEYIRGRVDSIFGGNYGNYDYADPIFKKYTYYRGEEGVSPEKIGTPRNGSGFTFPHLDNNSFIQFVPEDHSKSYVSYTFGGSAGHPGDAALNNSMQKETYVLLNDTKTKDANRFANMDVYGGGAFAGVGTSTTMGAGRTAIDLFAGNFHNIYGGCNQEGLVGYTRVNVPAMSTAKVNALFGGGKGYDISLFAADKNPELVARFCDHYVTCIDYKSKDAIVNDAIYGGNENCRISCDTYINIEAPVMQSSGYQATIYGAGYGRKTVSGRTNVFMNSGSNAYKVFGGGRDGNAFNFASLRSWLTEQFQTANPGASEAVITDMVDDYGNTLNSFATYLASNPITLPTNIGTYPNAEGSYNGTYTNDILPTQAKPMPDYHQTNVHIMNGGNVSGYAYGGGYGINAVVAGSTYIELKGGNVDRDIYGGGEGGPVFDEFGLKTFTATTNVNVEGGMARNVYGGGYLGSVGMHHNVVDGELVEAAITDNTTPTDILAVTNVAIGKMDGANFNDGAPAILRNVYGGGEGGSVYGSSNVTVNNGYIGYRYKNTGTAETPKYEYVEELDDQNPGDLELSGNVFGGGYVINSFVDDATINVYGGTVRGSLYGGGEIGPIGRGTMKSGYGGTQNNDAYIFRAGTTNVNMFGGLVKRNVFGGGRGKDSWGGDGTMFMDPALVATLDMKCKGFVFGQTHVNIHGGEIGTGEGMAYGYGNVFGGGDEGSVYSAYMSGGVLHVGQKDGVRYDGDGEGYYYDGGKLTEDCKVVVEPYAKAFVDIPVGGHSYKKDDYVPIESLNKLKGKNRDTGAWESPEWGSLDDYGIIIHNAVFAGGNLASGSSSLFANAKTVYGNATASIHDVYNRDLITIGTGHTGGLYGDGNLTFVDGYRELNITNYGTDYHHISKQLTYDQYNVLPEREQAYYELKYKCLVACEDIDGNRYSIGSNLPMDELLAQFTNEDGTSVKVDGKDVITTEDGKKVPNPDIWEQNGVVTVYAGRIMNTIQRADFCGVFGSRMVMKGAQDRVPEEADYTNYTINRVREVSLNKMDTPASDTDLDNIMHGNYFGIYSVVNYLGALTSDVTFDKVRVTENTDAKYKSKVTIDNVDYPYETASYYQWKQAHIDDRTRNNGTSHNKVALASGVYLELTSEKGTGKTVETKDWGLITGVVELDLINVQPGMGGGFVYAKNEHGKRTPSGITNTTLTKLNTGAASQKDYTYDPDDADRYKWETSGNFIHSTQTIIDDCYNITNSYLTTNFVKAHYWYIAGTVYVYDQYISAYTGSPNAYSETVEIPISVSAAANGTMTLMDVQPNFYAYYKDANTGTPLSGEQKLVINDVTYQLNDAISYWSWKNLTPAQQKLFVSDTYVTSAGCKIGNDTIYAGTVMRLADYNTYYASAATEEIEGKEVKAVFSNGKNVPFKEIFHSSNNLSHDTGYLLTYNVTNPGVWDKWYTKLTENDKITLKAYNALDASDKAAYTDGPTYNPTTAGVYGQQDYEINAIIPKKTYDDYQSLTNKPTENQAEFTAAYLVTEECTSNNQHYYPGAPVSAPITGFTSDAYVSTATIQLSATEYIYVNDLMTQTQINDYKTKYPSLATDIDDVVKPAYICTTAGKYGGSNYEVGKNYRALEAYSAMSPEDRANFKFNYDALDLLIDPSYSLNHQGRRYQYDGKDYDTPDKAKQNKATYSLPTPLDYTATYNGDNTGTHNGITLENGLVYDREQYEKLPNEQRHYTPITVDAEGGTYYVVKNKEGFINGDEAYATGTTISQTVYEGLTTEMQEAYITALTFPSSIGGKTYYYCREEYQINEKGEGVTPTIAEGVEGVDPNAGIVGSTVKLGTIINATSDVGAGVTGYNALPNWQKNFTIHGVSPMETSTLFVARNANINDLSTEKIITVIYKYDYEEVDVEGNITPVTERHVVNIHINFKSGVPTVEDINPPTIVLPGTGITMRVPSVTPGAYEITGGGWEIFEDEDDAESHINGVPYTPSVDPLYWYQDGFYLAYFAKTYLGKTYSNHVPVSVANYHDLKRVMDDKATHLHVDYDRTRLKRDSKIYINDYSASGKNGLDLFKDLYDLSLLTSSSTGVTADVVTAEGRLNGHHILNQTNGPKAGQNLEFILRTDIDHPDSWSTIGTDANCFKGNLHGDGHTITNLDHSLFYNLCGNVYNLGVTGSFNTAGVADKGTGYVESAWINTSGTPDGSVRAIFGAPNASSGVKQIVNSYYQTGKIYKTTDDGNHGVARAMNDRAFYNGEVAYDLNNFYLYKRYNDGVHTASGVEYKYYTLDASGNIPEPKTPLTGYYANHVDLCSSGYGNIKYVEERFADGDFVFAAGEIPTTENERHWIDKEHDNKSYYFPIWPDDYIFFGQKLTYGWAAETHQNVPKAVVRADGRLSTGSNANRVYRAPAYYRSKDMGVTHFNPHAYLVQQEKLTDEQIEYNETHPESAVTPRDAYPNMTAIDFKGHYEAHEAYGAYHKGNEGGLFYTPLLDDDGLSSIVNCDETQNLVVYSPAEADNKKTFDVLDDYFTEPIYNEHYDNSKYYRLVSEATSASVHGHLVQYDKIATNDHLLVDYQDFNAPIAYKFDDAHLMWYQRLPADREFVDLSKGWQGISIPFTAELVTTSQKGEITHFYGGSDMSYNSDTKKGHEYWLREYKNIEPTGDPVVAKATFNYPSATGVGKTVTNTFLWDYYYENQEPHKQLDENKDMYLQYRQYYKEPRSYAGYGNLTATKPYIIGFPGKTYYEFDLSGKFEAENTAVSIPRLGKQVITFASDKGAGIGVSDDEMTGVKVTYNGHDYTFKPSYMNKPLNDGDFVMNTEGNAYVKLNSTQTGRYHTIGSTYDDAAAFTAAGQLYKDKDGTELAASWANATTMYYKRQSETSYDYNEENHVTPSSSAFRPYFTIEGGSSPAKGMRGAFTKKIVFGGVDNDLRDGPETVLDGSLEIYTRGYNIVTTSHMKEATVISIITAAGATFANYVLQPGETIETTVPNTGVYVVNKKKVFIE